MLTVVLIGCGPHFFNSKNVRHFHSLLRPIVPIMNSIYTWRATNFTIFFWITVARVDLSKTRSQTELKHNQSKSGWEMKRWMRKWWREHDTEAFGHSVVAGTMRRMHKLAKLKGMPVCDYYTVGWQQRVFASVRYVILMRGNFSNYFKICSKITKRSFEKILTFLVDFILFLEKSHFPHTWDVFQLFFYKTCKKI